MSLARVTVVLVRTEGPLNLGSVARLCGNFGCGLRLVDVRADAAAREAVMMAHPSGRLLDEAPRFATLREALADIELAVGTSTKIVAARDRPPLDVNRARALLPAGAGGTAFVFGNERTGLLADEAALCHRVVRLDTPGPHPSLNLSHAVAAVLTVLALAAAEGALGRLTPEDRSAERSPPSVEGAARGDGAPTAGTAARERLVGDWLAALEDAGYFKTATAATFAPRLRALVDDMALVEPDVELLRGMLRVLAERRGA